MCTSRKSRDLRKHKPECGHPPWTMTYDEDRAQCGLCGLCWGMQYRPGGYRVGWKLIGIEED